MLNVAKNDYDKVSLVRVKGPEGYLCVMSGGR